MSTSFPMVYIARLTVDPGMENGFYNVDWLSFIVEYPRSLSSVKRSLFKGRQTIISGVQNTKENCTHDITQTTHLHTCPKIWDMQMIQFQGESGRKMAADYHHGNEVVPGHNCQELQYLRCSIKFLFYF